MKKPDKSACKEYACDKHRHAEIAELRRWSAEKVMGWEKRPDGYNWSYFMGTKYDRGDGYFIENRIFVQDWRPDDPTTGQIWLVVEKMRELGWELTLQTRKGKWSVRISKGIVAHAENDNLCRAILLAGKEFMEMEEAALEAVREGDAK